MRTGAPPSRAATSTHFVSSRGSYPRSAAAAATAAEEAADRARAAARALADADPARSRRPNELVLAQLVADAERLEEALAVDVDRFEEPVRGRAEAQAARTTELGTELRRLAAVEVELRQAASAAGERLSAVDVELARTDAERDEAQRRLDAAARRAGRGRRPRRARRASSTATSGAASSSARSTRSRKRSTTRRRSGSPSCPSQRTDLEKSLSELEQLRDDLTKTVETRFAETFEAVERHFHEVATTLFPGGEGRLRLTESEEEDEEPGIEVELRPAGKRVTRLSLLSGGEKALGAIAFLFSLFLARPSPFYLLDEVEAALDDTNIGRFTELLRTYADRAQFIVITHQKRTMEAADVLYGVTMGAGRRLADRLAPPAARRRDRPDRRERPRVRRARAATCLLVRGVDTWVFGGWGEELRGLIAPREHADLDLLYPAESWCASTPVARLGRREATRRGSGHSCSTARWSSSSSCRRDEHGWFTELRASHAPLAGQRLRDERQPPCRDRPRRSRATGTATAPTRPRFFGASAPASCST